MTMARTLPLLLLALLGAPFQAQAQTDKTTELFRDASTAVIDASALIFECLSAAKKDKTAPSKIHDAAKLLKTATDKYETLMGQRGGKEFVRPKEHEDLIARISSDFRADPVLKWQGAKTEGEIAQLNYDAIRGLQKTIESWQGQCQIPTRNIQAYVDFIGAKVRVEKASQLAEIAFSRYR